MSARMLTFEALECWKSARELRLHVFRRPLPALPPEEKYRLADQLLRAARSVTANLAEGYGRNHYPDNAKFCRNALGSCCEGLDHAICAHDEGMIPADLRQQTRGKVDATGRLINGYASYLKRAAETKA